MYSSGSTDYQKFSGATVSPPPASSTPTGIPVSSTDPYYSDKGAEPRAPLPPKPQVPWSTGLCDCFSDFRNCCLTFWCPCITFGQIAEIVDKGSSSCGQNGALYTLIACVTGCPCFYSCFYRSKMRQQYSLQESPCGDCLIHCCCEACALCQEYRELKNRGFDMSIGWHGNVERQNRGIAMAPIVEGGMRSCSTSMEEDRIFGGKTPPPPNLQLFPIASTPFDFFRGGAPFFRQPSNPNNLHLLVGASNGFRQIQRSFVSNVDKLLIMVDNIRRHTQILDKVLSFPAHLHACFQIPRSDSKSFSTLSSRNFAAILPGDAVGGLVVANGISSFLNIYNTLLIVRLVLTWFPNAPPAVVSPLSTLCDPYLNIFRGLIPPLGGLDLSPILAFLVLNAFTSTAAALPAELPHTGKASDKWTMRLAGSRAKRSKGEQV